MQQSPSTFARDQPRRSGWWTLAALFLAALLALVSLTGNLASGAGALVIIEDASQLGNGSFSGNVCYQVVRDSDGVTISEGCFSIAATIAAPEGFDTSQLYTIEVFLADDQCQLLDDPRSGNGSVPFRVRVTCDGAFMTATASAGTAAPADETNEAPGASAPVELTAWPPVYDLPTATILEPVSTEPAPMASPIPMSEADQAESNDDSDGAESGRDIAPGDAPSPPTPAAGS
jgi:hypothetical protein